MIKFRIVEDPTKYHSRFTVEIKLGLFKLWESIESFGSLNEAENKLANMARVYKRIRKYNSKGGLV